MDTKFPAERLRNLLLFPSYEWKVISLEDVSLRETFSSVIMKLIFAGAVAEFAGSFFYVRNVLDIDAYRFSFPLVRSLFYLLIQVLLIMTGSVFIHRIAGKYSEKTDFSRTAKLVAYSWVPVLLLFVIANLHQALIVALIPGVYSIVLFWKGSVDMLGIPKIRKPALTVMYALTMLGMMFLLTRGFGFLLSLIFPGLLPAAV